MKTPKVFFEDKSSQFLDIGDVVVLSKAGKAITTLGSCVSICLFSRRHQISVVCHAQLPDKASKNVCHTTCPDSCLRGRSCAMENKYINLVLPEMLKLIERKGIKRSMIDAAIIGGGSMLPQLSSRFSVGERNVKFSGEKLKNYGIKVLYKDIGGTMSRKLVVDNQSGFIFVNGKLVYKMWGLEKASPSL